MADTSISTIIGFVLFGISELIAVIPIPANGLLHSILIGLQNSLKNPNDDIEMAQRIVTNPVVAKMVKTIESNPNLSNTVDLLKDNQHIIPHINVLASNQSLQYICTLLTNNPEILDDVKNFITASLSKNYTIQMSK